MSLCQWT